MSAARQAIQTSLNQFHSRPDFRASATDFFKSLGYESSRTLKIADTSAAGFTKQFDLTADQFDSKKAQTENWQQFQFLFQFGDAEVQRAAAGDQSLSLFNQGINKGEKNSFFFHAVKLKAKPQGYRRTELADITRQLNRPFSLPTVVLFEHESCLTLGVINRRPTKSKKEQDLGKDVLEKVTLIKDIDLKKPHTAHLHILEELRLGYQTETRKVTNFDSLLNGWRATLSTTELNKRFYRELANWYFWALQHVQFPTTTDSEATTQHTAVIRLITRLIFVWFLKEKKLVPAALFDEAAIKKLLNFKDKTDSTYYKAILQNLFFATINAEMNTAEQPQNRRFLRSADQQNKEYFVHSYYRYERFFTDKAAALALFANVPFLNGGLFECLDRKDGVKETRTDCFSDNPRNEKLLTVPDFLFFDKAEHDIDLNDIYATSRKKYKVRGLFTILSNYKFTVAENTPVEEEVALDPELLGKVFENLLASYNPETKTTARKQTGSFYTPREVVDYMVDETLIAYLGAALTPTAAPVTPASHAELGSAQINLFGNAGKLQPTLQLEVAPPTSSTPTLPAQLTQRLRDLLAYNHIAPAFSPTEKQVLLEAIHRCRILDPACGSGAYPMGILHKMVFLLNRLDPTNTYWHELQRQQALLELGEATKIADAKKRGERLAEINAVFEENLHDYTRKLYLIENCIYGADIQPIAVQISKLRFFISLVVDQRPDDSKLNRGIRPLPNLETKFVAANSLISLTKGFGELFESDVRDLEKELARVRHQHFLARTWRDKKQCRDQDEQLRQQLVSLIETHATEHDARLVARIEELQGYIRTTMQQLAGKATRGDEAKRRKQLEQLQRECKERENKRLNQEGVKNSVSQVGRWNPYDQHATATFFDREWMFGENVASGFDIVIGNPPYIQIQNFSNSPGKEQEQWAKQEFDSYSRTADVYCLFYEQGVRMLRPGGLLCYITSNSWMRAGYGSLLRSYFSKHTNPLQLLDFAKERVFDSATVNSNVLLVQKVPNQKQAVACVVGSDFDSLDNLSLYFQQHAQPANFDTAGQAWVVLNAMEARIKAKIEAVGTPLKDWDVNIYRGIKTGYNDAFIIDEATKNKLIQASPKSAEIIRPILRGRDVKQYRAHFANLWLLNTHNGQKTKGIASIDTQTDHPYIFKHLSTFKTVLEIRKDKGQHWTNLRNCAYLDEFAKEKIIWIELTDKPKFALDTEGYFLNNTIFFMTGPHLRYLLGFLNSSLCEWYLDKLAASSGTGTRRWFKVYVEQLSIPQIGEEQQKAISLLVDEAILSDTIESRRHELKRLLDLEIFKLLNLTSAEASFIQQQQNP
jgi:adenine-specific DNA-methyltransferase